MSRLVFWGSALVLLLAKWINLNNQETQDFWVEICEQILNGVFRCRGRPRAVRSHSNIIGLFCLTGIGLIPWRIVDTYRSSLLHWLLHISLILDDRDNQNLVLQASDPKTPKKGRAS